MVWVCSGAGSKIGFEAGLKVVSISKACGGPEAGAAPEKCPGAGAGAGGMAAAAVPPGTFILQGKQ